MLKCLFLSHLFLSNEKVIKLSKLLFLFYFAKNMLLMFISISFISIK